MFLLKQFYCKRLVFPPLRSEWKINALCFTVQEISVLFVVEQITECAINYISCKVTINL